jgi:UDP-GlcNAc:undecaprenyl-phosphate GlcNAc-1-phosphate transferase
VLPDPRIQSQNMGLIAAQVILLLFSYEVLLGEMRENIKKLGLTTMAALLVFGLKGFLQ